MYIPPGKLTARRVSVVLISPSVFRTPAKAFHRIFGPFRWYDVSTSAVSPILMENVTGTIIGMLAWGVSQTGNAGPLFEVESTAPSVPWAILFGIMSILGGQCSAC